MGSEQRGSLGQLVSTQGAFGRSAVNRNRIIHAESVFHFLKPTAPHVAASTNLDDYINKVNVKLASKVEAHLTEKDAIVNETQGTHT
jgi:hypothetical protein